MMLRRLCVVLVLAWGVGGASARSTVQDDGPPGWPDADRRAIAAVVAQAPAGTYAVFDADGTLWSSDIEESLLPWLEQHGRLSPEGLPAELRPVPLQPSESLYGYYRRLCEIDDKLCYPWIAQVLLAGHTLAELKAQVDALLESETPIPVRYRLGGHEVEQTVMPPRVYPAQRRLVQWLRAHGVRVCVVSASAEELVRMVAADPRYGLEVAPADVIGVNVLLRAPDGSVTTARRQIAQGHFLDAQYPPQYHAAMTATPTLWSPLTWQEGKVAAILADIDPVRPPLLVAGDSRSDWPMLFHSGALRLWVDHDPAATAGLATLRRQRAVRERALWLPRVQPADHGWIVATPAALSR